jgi:signal transduction histidine kinase
MLSRARGWLRDHPLVSDVLLAAGLLLVWSVAYLTAADLTDRAAVLLDVLASIAGVTSVALRRVAPWPAVALVAAVMVGAPFVQSVPGAENAAYLVVVYTVASILGLRQAVAATAVVAVAATTVLLRQTRPEPFSVWFSEALILAVCFFVGRTVQTRRAYTQALEDRARTAEESRELAARDAVLDERRRIARELHDVVAHHISVMGVLATGARRTLYRDPTTADEALKTIEDTGRTTLREMRRLLDVLRTDADEAEAPVEPQPGVAGLDALVAQVREAGLPVRLVVEGEPVTLAPGVDLTVYRIVQEGLTNTLKHAGPAVAEVRLRYTGTALELEVADDGRGPRPADVTPSGGHGLVGMQERVSLYGGRLQTGPRRDGGFLVKASLPLDADAPVPCPGTGR